MTVSYTLLLAAFSAGLVGGVHCAGMCGGIAALIATPGEPSSELTNRPQNTRRWLTIITQNAGRIFTYSVLGAIAGATGDTIASLLPDKAAILSTRVISNFMVVLVGLYIGGWLRLDLPERLIGQKVWGLVRPCLLRIIRRPEPHMKFAIGALWGFMPCGMVYTMLTASIASTNSLLGSMYMLMFGLGTLPWLLTVSAGSRLLQKHLQTPKARRYLGLALITIALISIALTALPPAIHQHHHSHIA